MADQFERLGTRVCKLRFSLIIDEKSEIMKKINLGFKFGVGLIFGSGQQHFPWIHSRLFQAPAHLLLALLAAEDQF